MLPLIAALLIQNADAVRDDGVLNVTVEAGATIDVRNVRSLLEDRRLVFTVNGATIKSAKDTFYRHHRYLQVARKDGAVELEIPIGSRVACSAPVELASTATGFTATVKCRSSKKSEDSEPVAEAQPEEAPVRKAEPQPVIIAPPPKPAAAPVATVAAAAPVAAPVKAEPAKLDAPKPALELAPETKSSAFFLPAALLAVLAGAALWLRRRAPALPKRIEILETASLGARRSIVLARVGSEVLLLGSSEAGVTLLHTCATDGDAGDLTLDAATAQPQTPTFSDTAKNLLHRVRMPPARTSDTFDDVLGEAGEDRELRMKLAAAVGSAQ